MTLDIDDIARAMASSPLVDEWIVREKQKVTLARELGMGDVAVESSARSFEVAIFRDRRQSRGEARLTLTPQAAGQLAARLTSAADRATRNKGPLWRLPPPTAPARVELADPELIAAPAESLDSVAASLAAIDRRTRIPMTRVALYTTRERVRASTGYDHEYVATELDVAATLMIGRERLRTTTRFERRVRRLADLDLERQLRAAIASLTRRAGAEPTPPGTYDLVLDARALQRARARSWLSPLIAQASGELARRGLAQYQPGQPVAAAGGGDALTVTSDGTIAFALESAPFDTWGGPVRRFTLIENGQAAGLALDQREAALRGVRSNGGVRNPTLAPGALGVDQLTDGGRPRLTISDIAWLETNDATGAIAGEIDLATVSGSGSGDGVSRTGGQFSFDLFTAIGRMRPSADTVQHGAGAGGPAWIGVSNVEVR